MITKRFIVEVICEDGLDPMDCLMEAIHELGAVKAYDDGFPVTFRVTPEGSDKTTEFVA